MPRSDALQGALPILVLKILARRGPLHGYAITTQIETASDVLRVEEGSLYPALHRLEKRGWVRAEWAASETGREARFYALTRVGRKQLEEQSENWNRLSAAISGILRTAE
jgi:PadR family transcriptional regulator